MKHPLEVINYDCRDCKLYKHRTLVVWGNYNPLAKIVFMGEGPGEDEDLSGFAFVGRSGRLLVRFIKAIGFDTDNVLFLNLIRCRPPNNRNPKKDEIRACSKYLKRQLRCCPNLKVMVCLGRVPWNGMTGRSDPVTKNHGKVINKGNLKMLYTYHPSYILRNNTPEVKKDFIRDLRKAFKLAGA